MADFETQRIRNWARIRAQRLYMSVTSLKITINLEKDAQVTQVHDFKILRIKTWAGSQAQRLCRT